MEAIIQPLVSLARHPRRRFFVIILTCGVGLLAVWPAVDDYLDRRQIRAELILTVDEVQRQVERLHELELLAIQRKEALTELEGKTVSEQTIDAFRGEIVELVRRNGCQLRRIELSPPSRRVWREQDHPLQAQMSNQTSAETPYRLRSQRLILTVSGPFVRVAAMLNQLREKNKLTHTNSLSIRPTGNQRKEVVLELEVVLFDLENAKPPIST